MSKPLFISRRRNEEFMVIEPVRPGKFLLAFSPNGNVAGVDAVTSTGSLIPDQVTRDALRQWRCKPGGYTRMYVPVIFTLTGIQR